MLHVLKNAALTAPDPVSTKQPISGNFYLISVDSPSEKKVGNHFARNSSGILGAHDTTLNERVEPSSFVAGGDRLPVHLSSFQNYSMSWRRPDSDRKLRIFFWRKQNKVERDTTSHLKGSCKT